jgi:predicted enzyme related to lactoylglutathione lyase
MRATDPPADTASPRGSEAPLELGPVGNVFYFVDDVPVAVAWYAARLRRSPVVVTERLAAFDVNGVRLTIHGVDEFDDRGPAGVAAYWDVPDVDGVAAEWIAHGAVAHRGPKTVSTGERLCQLIDPFGNLFCVRQEIPDTAGDAE